MEERGKGGREDRKERRKEGKKEREKGLEGEKKGRVGNSLLVLLFPRNLLYWIETILV